MTTNDPAGDSAAAPENGAGNGAHAARATSFGAVAAAYDLGRPTFPVEALSWILGPGRGLQVLDLGAGTGKLAAVAAGLGHDVIAVDPSQEMLEVCRRRPGIDTMVGAAESIPLAHASVDAVIVGQAFHWFDHARALPEIARVLRPGGVLGLLWNNADTVVPWVRRIWQVMQGDGVGGSDRFDPVPIIEQSNLFTFLESARFRHWHDLNREGLRQLAQSHSRVAVLKDTRRDQVLDQIDLIYEHTARPPEALRMPYFTDCFRAHPSEFANYRRTVDGPVAPHL
ncbi:MULTISPECIES: class I SAM-dependent methyltransferase [Kribbella]|jgi:SAM-dependent methyltransferase|uniref:Methyltransferase family protein n=1 Tax=Kribbella pratensis TaxID=2512112 RepID=A0ABY2FFP4_9ACTN|nr:MULTISPECIES: class I SAM-dependent methyltransferase [Kribbella]TDW90197.1 methyltransferase family protein [Kribbella pratensis]TDW97918.1 methyltransferase family protein [Kribbella sp. VKM Ac-2566]